MIWDRCANAIEAPDYENCKMDVLQTLAMEVPFTEEEFRNEKKEKLADRTFDAAMELFKRKTERMAQRYQIMFTISMPIRSPIKAWRRLV